MDQIIYCNLNKHYTTYFSITDRAKYDSKFKSPFFNNKEEKNEQIKRIEKYYCYLFFLKLHIQFY